MVDSIKKSYEFNTIYKKGKRYTIPFMKIFYLPNDYGRWRIGMAVGKKVGGAVRRNRIKRLIRESFRMSFNKGQDILPSCDMVINVHPSIGEKGLEEILNALRGFVGSFVGNKKPARY